MEFNENDMTYLVHSGISDGIYIDEKDIHILLCDYELSRHHPIIVTSDSDFENGDWYYIHPDAREIRVKTTSDYIRTMYLILNDGTEIKTCEVIPVNDNRFVTRYFINKYMSPKVSYDDYRIKSNSGFVYWLKYILKEKQYYFKNIDIDSLIKLY